MSKKEIIRKEIISKFKSLSYFSLVTGVNYKKMLSFLCSDHNDSEFEKDLLFKINNTEVDEHHGLIRDVDRKAIRMCVLTSFKSYSAFHREHDDYDSVYLSNVIGGRLSDETEKYQNLIKLLTVDYDLDPLIWYRIKKVSKLKT